MDHLHELQGRLFSIAIIALAGAGVGYVFFRDIERIILAPYSKGQDLVYLTPGGAIGFMMQVCVYVGIIIALPAIIFHIYRFVMPAVKATHLRTVVGYTIASLLLSVAGIIFAYVVSLPASLYFLTSFDLEHINAMLTVDAYFSFVMTYLFAGALLFQLPLVMLIINSVTPLTPKKLMGKQRIMIVASFVVAAVISPTPDALNQTLLASPVIVMYQVGIILIWFKNHKRMKREKKGRVAQAVPAQIVKTAPKQGAAPIPSAVPALATTAVTSSPIPQRRQIDFVKQKTLPTRRPAPVRSPARPVAKRMTTVRQFDMRPARPSVAQMTKPAMPPVTPPVSSSSAPSRSLRLVDGTMGAPGRVSSYFSSASPRRNISPFASVSPVRTLDGIVAPKRV